MVRMTSKRCWVKKWDNQQNWILIDVKVNYGDKKKEEDLRDLSL